MATIKIQKKKDQSQLGTAINLQQYITSDNQKIITIIAEYHNYNFNCLNNKDISDFCLDEVNNNQNCRILLEYSKYDNPKTIGSKTINSTYNNLVKHKKEKHLIPVDYRTLFLKAKGQSDLYDIDWKKTELSEKEIIKQFIQPFYQSAKRIFSIDSAHYNYQSYLNIKKYITNEIVRQFELILKNIHEIFNSDNLSYLQNEIKLTWNKVMDIGIIITILKRGKVDEFILVAGLRHCQNLKRMLNTYFKTDFRFIHEQERTEQRCIELSQINDKL